MTLRTTIISTSRHIDFEIPSEMVGKELEITATEKRVKKNQSLNHQYKMASVENKELTKEFQSLDLEGWENIY